MVTPQTLVEPVIPALCLMRAERLLASGERKILGLVAPPGAGKSTLAQALANHFSQHSQIVAMDGFHLANCELARLGRAQRKGAPDTFDVDGYVNLLRRIKVQAGSETIYAPEFRRELEEAVAAAVAVAPATSLIITEGNYLLLEEGAWAQVRGELDETWYLEVAHDLRHQRLLQRHLRFGRTLAQAQAWISQTDEPNARRIELCRQHADLVVPWG
jgi:pantothenate kinase